MLKLGIISRSAGMLLAIDACSIVEVLPPVSCRPAPGVPEWIRGLFVHRGNLIPLVDTSLLLHTPPPPDKMSNRVIVVRLSNTNATTGTVGLWVDQVLGVDRIDFAAAGAHPGLATASTRFLGSVVQTDLGQVQWLNPAELFTEEQLGVLTGRVAEVQG